ncbi:MAG: type 4a pilus biogenesis protein PilO [Candidatus Omnitrophota bacterium]
MDAFEFMTKHKNRIFNLLFFALSLFIAGKIYNKQLREVDLLIEKKNLESKRNEILESISSTEKKIDAYKNLLERRDVSNVINTISDIASATDVSITSMRPNHQEKYPEYVKIPYKLELATESYHNLGRFLSRLESHEDVFMVDSIDIRTQERSDGLKAALTLNLVVYK